jgi:hypothetical protein
MALPMLDGMLPSVRAYGDVVGNTAAGLPKRTAFLYVPNGATMEQWTPATFGAEYEMPTTLEPLARHRRDFSIVTGLAHPNGDSLGDGGGDHARASAVYLTGAHPKKTAGADIRAGISIDQFAARQIGDQTRLPSLELSCDGGQRAGSCDSGYSCAYQFNLSWRSETMPINPEVDPRLAFDRLFAGGNSAGSVEARTRRQLYSKSVLDFVMTDARALQTKLGATDSRKLDEYFTAVREVEQRLERFEKFPPKVPDGVSAPEMFETYEQQMQLMYDILVLAFQTDSTRISTFIVAHDGSNRPYPTIGVPEGHHDLSHHRNDEEKKAKLAKINRYHTTQFARFLDKLKAVKEGDGTLLDNCAIVYGSGISDGNRHSHYNLPVLVAGGMGGQLRTGEHLKVEVDTPMTNLYLSLLHGMGVKADRFSDSTGAVKEILV